MIIEVGAGKKGYRQVIQTAKKIEPIYSLVISDDGLSYSKEFNAIKVPLRLFLLA